MPKDSMIFVTVFDLPGELSGPLFTAVAEAVHSVWPRADVTGGPSCPRCKGIDPGPQP